MRYIIEALQFLTTGAAQLVAWRFIIYFVLKKLRRSKNKSCFLLEWREKDSGNPARLPSYPQALRTLISKFAHNSLIL
jgi:hypothetical protein